MSVSTCVSISAVSSMASISSALPSDQISVAGEKGLATCLTSFWEFAKISDSKDVLDQLRELTKKSTEKIDKLTDLSLKDLSGKSIENMSKKLRSMVCSFTNSMPPETRERLFSICKPGRIHNRVKEGLTDIEFAVMEHEPITLRKVYFCQSSLAASDPDSPLGKLRSIFVHEFLVVETEVQQYGSKYKKCVRAEKFGLPPGDTGIVIQCAKECDEDGVRDCENFTIDCGGTPITLKQLENILGDYEKDYSLKNSCCWDYARDMSKKLLKFCRDLPQTSNYEKLLLEKELQSLERRILQLGGAAAEIVNRAENFIRGHLSKVIRNS